MPRTSDFVSWGLIAGAVALGVVYVLDRDAPTTKEQASRAGLLLRVFRPEEITRITLDRRGEKVEIVREGDAWKMTSPRVAMTDFLAVTSFLNALQGARSERALGNVQGSERAQLGLDAPRVKLEIAMKGVTLRLALGAGAPGSTGDAGATSAYLELAPYADDKGGVFVVGPDVASALDRGPDSFREPSLLSGQQSTTFTKIEIKNGLTLERSPHGAWRIPSGVPGGAPGAVRASADAVDGLLRALYELKADPFVADSTPLDPSKGGTVEITQLDGVKLVIVYGGPCPTDPKLVVAQAKTNPPSTGCVPGVVAERVSAPAAMYVDGRAFGLLHGSESAKISEIESILVEAGGVKVIDAERRADGLHLRAPADEQVDKESTDRYLGRLAAVAGFVVPSPDLAALGLSPAAGKVTIRRRVDKLTLGASSDAGSEVWEQVIELSAPMPADPQKKDGPQVVYVRRLDDGAVLRVPVEVAQPIRLTAAQDLRTPNLLSVRADTIAHVTVKRPGETGYEVKRTDGVWSLLEPKGLGADGATVSTLTNTLSTLLCQRWAAEKDDGSFGFAAPSLTVEIERLAPAPAPDAGPEPSAFTVELGKESNDAIGGVYARVKGRDPVCVLPLGKRDVLLKAPVDFRSVGFDALETPRITATRGAHAQTVVYNDATKAWTSGSDAGSDLVARKLADAFRGLRAEGLVHLGPAKPEEGLAAPALIIEGQAATASKNKRIVVGGPGKLGEMPIYYVRVDGLDATWAVVRADVDAILALL